MAPRRPYPFIEPPGVSHPPKRPLPSCSERPSDTMLDVSSMVVSSACVMRRREESDGEHRPRSICERNPGRGVCPLSKGLKCDLHPFSPLSERLSDLCANDWLRHDRHAEFQIVVPIFNSLTADASSWNLESGYACIRLARRPVCSDQPSSTGLQGEHAQTRCLRLLSGWALGQ